MIYRMLFVLKLEIDARKIVVDGAAQIAHLVGAIENVSAFRQHAVAPSAHVNHIGTARQLGLVQRLNEKTNGAATSLFVTFRMRGSDGFQSDQRVVNAIGRKAHFFIIVV